MREGGLRPVDVWVPGVREEPFEAEAKRQSALTAQGDLANDDQALIEAISAPWGEE